MVFGLALLVGIPLFIVLLYMLAILSLIYDLVFFVIVAVLVVFFLAEIVRVFSGLLGLLQVMRAEIHRALNAAKRHV